MKKAFFVTMIVLMLAPLMPASGVNAESKTSFKISVSQFVEHPALDAVLKGFQNYMKGKQIEVIYSIHNAQANMATANQIASQIMGESPDLILAIATPTSQAIAQALKKAPQMQNTPFLFTAVTDPISAGLVKDLEHPGKNITGVSDLLPVDKHMKMLKTFLPNLKNLGVLYNSGEANSKKTVEMIRKEGKKLGFTVTDGTISKSSEVYQAAKSLVGRVDAVFVPTDNTVVSALESAIKVCSQNKLPLFCADVDSVARGAVAAMGFDYYKHGYQTGDMALRILNGAKAGKTPVETQRELQLHINLKYAKLMGVIVPELLLSAADKVYR
ncbi:ABC transporter substrate-binding protein [Desulfobacterales bacterium HSG16]|nr:ABC transporter substrate-binding protein [Desulfobacterales bacterium HSG16]